MYISVKLIVYNKKFQKIELDNLNIEEYIGRSYLPFMKGQKWHFFFWLIFNCFQIQLYEIIKFDQKKCTTYRC